MGSWIRGNVALIYVCSCMTVTQFVTAARLGSEVFSMTLGAICVCRNDYIYVFYTLLETNAIAVHVFATCYVYVYIV